MRLEVAGDRQQLARPSDRGKELDRADGLCMATGGGRAARRVQRCGSGLQEGEEVTCRDPAAARLNEVDELLVAGRADNGPGAGSIVGSAERRKSHG